MAGIAAVSVLPSAIRIALNPWTWAAIVVAVLTGSLCVQTWRVDHLKAALASSRSQVSALSADIRIQNQAVEALAAAGARLTADRTAAADQAVQAVRQAGAALSRKIAAIKAAKPGPDHCASALALIHRSVQ